MQHTRVDKQAGERGQVSAMARLIRQFGKAQSGESWKASRNLMSTISSSVEKKLP